MLKIDEKTNPNSCLNKAADDEPVFVIRAKDVLGSLMVDEWADEAERGGHHEPSKIREARALAQKMRVWRAAWLAKQLEESAG